MSETSENIESAFFQGQINGVIAVIYENERPLQGLAGRIDWKFKGTLSRFFRQGAISGKSGESTYIPYRGADRDYHVILLGAGRNTTPGERRGVPTSAVEALYQNLKTLKINRFGLSLKDFGGISKEAVEEKLQGVPLWIAP